MTGRAAALAKACGTVALYGERSEKQHPIEQGFGAIGRNALAL